MTEHEPRHASPESNRGTLIAVLVVVVVVVVGVVAWTLQKDTEDSAESECQKAWDDGEGNAGQTDMSEDDWVAECTDEMVAFIGASDHIGEVPDAASPIDTADIPNYVSNVEGSSSDSQWYVLEGPGETITYIETQPDTLNLAITYGDCDAAVSEYPELDNGVSICYDEIPSG